MIKKAAIPKINKLILSRSKTSPIKEKNRAIRYNLLDALVLLKYQAIKEGIIKGLQIDCKKGFSKNMARTSTNDTNIKNKNRGLENLLKLISYSYSGSRHFSDNFKSNGFNPFFRDSDMILEVSL